MGTNNNNTNNNQPLAISEHIDINSDPEFTAYEQLDMLTQALMEVGAPAEVQAIISYDLDRVETLRLIGPAAAVAEALDLLAEY